MATEKQLYHLNDAISPVTEAATVYVPVGDGKEALTTTLNNITTSVGDCDTNFVTAYSVAKSRNEDM